MIVTFAGGFLASLFLGEPLLTPFRNTQAVLLASAVWYAMFYSPFDVVYKVSKFLPIKIVIGAMKEVYRCKKVHDGVSHAAKLFPNAWLILFITGLVKGCNYTALNLYCKLHLFFFSFRQWWRLHQNH